MAIERTCTSRVGGPLSTNIIDRTCWAIDHTQPLSSKSDAEESTPSQHGDHTQPLYSKKSDAEKCTVHLGGQKRPDLFKSQQNRALVAAINRTYAKSANIIDCASPNSMPFFLGGIEQLVAIERIFLHLGQNRRQHISKIHQNHRRALVVEIEGVLGK
jgi:hypothetical protein